MNVSRLKLLWFAYTSYTRTTWYSKFKTIPRHFFARKLWKFSASPLVNKFSGFWQIWTQHQKLVTSPPPPPPPYSPAKMGIRDFSISGLSIKSWSPTPSPLPPPAKMGIWDFSISGLSIKSWLPNAPPHLQKWEFGILAFLDSAWKVGHEPPGPPPTCKNGNLGFSISGLSIKSWSPTPTHPHPLWKWEFGILACEEMYFNFLGLLNARTTLSPDRGRLVLAVDSD